MNNNFSSNSNGQNNLLQAVLNQVDLARAGREAPDLPSAVAYARAQARALRTDPYDPTKNHDDRLREDAFQKSCKDYADAELVSAHAITNVKDGERKAAELQKGLREPKVPTRILVAAIIAIAFSLGFTFHDQFLAGMDDQFLAWILAMVGGAFIGALVTWSVAGIYDPSGQRSTINLAGLIGGLGIGLCGLLIRLASGDFLIGLALTILEFSAVGLLELHAAPLREHYRVFAAGQQAHTQATAVLQSLNTEATRRNQHREAIRQQLEQHEAYVAIRTFCSQKFAEIEEAAVQIAIKAFLEKQAEDSREQQRKQEEEHKHRLGLV